MTEPTRNSTIAPAGAVTRVGILLYGVTTYALFLGTFLYAIGFVGGFAVPTTLDGAPTMPWANALAIDLALLTLFAVPHSVMARPAFKRWWTQMIPESAERSTYVLVSNVSMIAMFYWWEPLGGSLWNLSNPVAVSIMYLGFALGWGLVLVSTFLTSHWDLFGLRQVWLQFRQRDYEPIEFVAPLPYRIVRHPLYLGWLIAFWFTPTMTVSHLVFAVMTSAYILIAIVFEEQDLADEHGDVYRRYQDQVPMIIPAVGKPRGQADLNAA